MSMVRSAGTVSWGIGGGFQLADIERRTAPRCNDVRIPFLTLAALWNTLLPKLISCPGFQGFQITSRFTHLDRCFSRADE